MNFIFFTTIGLHVLQLLLLSFAGTDVSARGSLMLEEVGEPGEKNPHVRLGDDTPFSYKTKSYELSSRIPFIRCVMSFGTNV